MLPKKFLHIFRELILSCCTEFIHLVSSEANDICNTQNKKTINAEHVLQGWSYHLSTIRTFSFLISMSQILLISALDNLGYGDFRKDAEDALAECKGIENIIQIKLDRHLAYFMRCIPFQMLRLKSDDRVQDWKI